MPVGIGELHSSAKFAQFLVKVRLVKCVICAITVGESESYIIKKRKEKKTNNKQNNFFCRDGLL